MYGAAGEAVSNKHKKADSVGFFIYSKQLAYL